MSSDQAQFISITEAGENYLDNISVNLPKYQLVMLSGPSGCGKTSLAVNCIYAEAQRRFLESLSLGERSMLTKLRRPRMLAASGLSPSILLSARQSFHAHAMVGDLSEVADYLQIIFAAAADIYHRASGLRQQRYSRRQIIEQVAAREQGLRLMLGVPLNLAKLQREELGEFLRHGYVRAMLEGRLQEIEQLLEQPELPQSGYISIIIDRLVLRESSLARFADSLDSALRLSGGKLDLFSQQSGETHWQHELFSTRFYNPFDADELLELTPQLFNVHGRGGACPACFGRGKQQQLSAALLEDFLRAHKQQPLTALGELLSSGDKLLQHTLKRVLMAFLSRCNIASEDLSQAGDYAQLPQALKASLLFGSNPPAAAGLAQDGQDSGNFALQGLGYEELLRQFEQRGVLGCLQALHDSSATSARHKRALARLCSAQACRQCAASGYNALALSAGLGEQGLDIAAWLAQDIESFSHAWQQLLQQVSWPQQLREVAGELDARLQVLLQLGLGYLPLDRSLVSLSGGELQRLRLAAQLAGGLSGIIYVLDEPSQGLHARDAEALYACLQQLKQNGNSLLVIEHDLHLLAKADYLLDLGPGAGAQGGKLLYAGSCEQLRREHEQAPAAQGLSAPSWDWVSGRKNYADIRRRRSVASLAKLPRIKLRGLNLHNICGLDVDVPLGCFVGVIGVSGSGKSTLVSELLYPLLQAHLHPDARGLQHEVQALGSVELSGKHDLSRIKLIDQHTLGRSLRANLATSTRIMALLRSLFAGLALARQRGYKAGHFSFNRADGGRCERCSGLGVISLDLRFMADNLVECDACGGKRFNQQTLQVCYKGKNLAEVLELSVQQACEFFANQPQLLAELERLQQFGLGYLRLGQSTASYAAGELQRLKLASELGGGKRAVPGKCLYIFDEPTGGLHASDVSYLLRAMQELLDAGHSVVCIEHNFSMLACCDWLLELGPEGGKQGGKLLYNAAAEKFHECKNSPSLPFWPRA